MFQSPFEPPAAAPGNAPRGSEARARATRDRILDAAEALFAERGFAATSLRQVTARARVNLAAVNYHFGSKEELFQAAVLRRIEPVNRRRIELLEQAEARHDPPQLEAVVRAFIEPVLEVRGDHGEPGPLPRLLARILGEPGGWAQRILPAAIGAVAARFLEALGKIFPRARREDLAWGTMLTAGAMAQYVLAGGILRALAEDGRAEADAASASDRLVRFAAAGLRALGGEERKPKKAAGKKKRKK